MAPASPATHSQARCPSFSGWEPDSLPRPVLGRMKRAMSLSMLNTDGSRAPENQVRGPLDRVGQAQRPGGWSGWHWNGPPDMSTMGFIWVDAGGWRGWSGVGTGRWADKQAGGIAPLGWGSPVSRPHPPPACPQFPRQHLSEASRTLSTSTQDLGPR